MHFPIDSAVKFVICYINSQDWNEKFQLQTLMHYTCMYKHIDSIKPTVELKSDVVPAECIYVL
jgi:hypothetical protein